MGNIPLQGFVEDTITLANAACRDAEKTQV
jgi:hypothetical protein